MIRALALLLLAASAPLAAQTEARQAAAGYVLEKLSRRNGDLWERNGQYFIWQHRVERNGCGLRVERRDLAGDLTLIQQIPLDRTVAVWLGESSLRFYCEHTLDCIELRSDDRAGRRLRRVGVTHLAVMESTDLPKLRDAFAELHRLCDSPYGP